MGEFVEGFETLRECCDEHGSVLVFAGTSDMGQGARTIFAQIAATEMGTAVEDVSVRIPERSITVITGPSGSGKTTLVNLITRFVKPTTGTVSFKGRKISHLPPHKIVRLGIARTFQNIRLFPNMTVLENVMIGRHCRTKSFILGAVLRDKGTQREEQEIFQMSHAILEKIFSEELPAFFNYITYFWYIP